MAIKIRHGRDIVCTVQKVMLRIRSVNSTRGVRGGRRNGGEMKERTRSLPFVFDASPPRMFDLRIDLAVRKPPGVT